MSSARPAWQPCKAAGGLHTAVPQQGEISHLQEQGGDIPRQGHVDAAPGTTVTALEAGLIHSPGLELLPLLGSLMEGSSPAMG